MSAENRPQEVADIVDGLGDTPTPREVYDATDKYDTDYIAAAAYAAAKGGGGGGSSANGATLLGPFPLTYNTAGLVNPNDNGIPTIDVPAGSVVLSAFPIFGTEWAGAEAGDTLYASLLTSANGSGALVGAWDILFTVNTSVSLPTPNPFSFIDPDAAQSAPVAFYMPRPALAVENCSIFVNIYAAGTLTAGTLDMYALVATPLA